MSACYPFHRKYDLRVSNSLADEEDLMMYESISFVMKIRSLVYMQFRVSVGFPSSSGESYQSQCCIIFFLVSSQVP